jgi:hypothetical protein
MESIELIKDLNRSYELQLADHLSLDQLEALLTEKMNALIRGDFGALVQLLYRVDVSEARLRQLLRGAEGGQDGENTGEDAGKIIARLVMERQWQKIETRRKFKGGATAGEEGAGPEEERW